jgi:hypothetical protein
MQSPLVSTLLTSKSGPSARQVWKWVGRKYDKQLILEAELMSWRRKNNDKADVRE